MKEKILIVLSDQTLSNLISQKLSSQNYSVITALSGEESLKKMRTEKPDLVLIDLVLPGKSGYDVINEKSLDRMITKIPLIVISNAGSPVNMQKLPSASGVVRDYFIRTHIEPDEVLEKVKNVLNEKSDKQVKSTTSSITSSQGTKKIAKKILWVEDDKFLGSILIKKFEASGHIVETAINADEAFTILEKEKPDVIILDILLPGMNGFDILQKIKGMERLRNIPVMMLSNLSRSTDIDRAHALGANRYLVKVTVSINEIIKEVDSMMKT